MHTPNFSGNSCQTAMHDPSNVSFSSNKKVVGSTLPGNNHESPYNVHVNNNSLFETTLNRVGFMPLTPSIQRADLKEFELTPIGESNVCNPQQNWGVFCDNNAEDCSNQVPKKNLPTIEENPEIEPDSRITKNAIFPLRKKLLFCEKPEPKHTPKSKPVFSIFVDED